MNIKTILSQIFQNKNIRFWGLQVFLALFLLFGGIYAVLLSLDGFTETNEKVKKDRKIYLTINPTNYRKVELPKIIRRPLKEARPNLASLSLKIGKITYVNDISKDAVLRVFHKGKEIHPGDKIFENSVIDLECGNGFSMGDPESISNSTQQEGGNTDNSEGIDF